MGDASHAPPSDDVTEDRLLGGRVRLYQPRRGYRVAIDPVLLAAAVPAVSGQTVLDVGCGSGAVFACLAARVPGVRVTGIERNPALLALARRNASVNHIDAAFIEGDVLDPHIRLGTAQFDHVVSNPPFWADHAARRKATQSAAEAHRMPQEALCAWLDFCAARLAPEGVLSVIVPPARLEEACGALVARSLSLKVFPFLSKAGGPAKRLILKAYAGGGGVVETGTGLILHQADGAYTAAADDLLRHAKALKIR